MITNRNYFFTPTVNSERLLSQDEPTEQVMRNLLDSVTFKLEVSDTATETQQGLVETATQVELDNGTDNNANGFALYVRPSMIKSAINQLFNFLQPQIDNNSSSITDIQGDITTIQGDITTIQGDIIDIQNQFGEEMPIGSMLMYPKSVTPNAKWMLCEGQSLNTITHAELFSLIGYDFGGAGVNFNLPDLRSKFIAGFNAVGAPEYSVIGQGAGADQVTLTGNQSGTSVHDHTASTSGAGAHTHGVTVNVRTNAIGGSNVYSMVNDENTNNSGVVQLAGENDASGWEGTTMTNPGNHTHPVTVNDSLAVDAIDAHENRPSFLAFPHIIKVLN